MLCGHFLSYNCISAGHIRENFTVGGGVADGRVCGGSLSAEYGGGRGLLKIGERK